MICDHRLDFLLKLANIADGITNSGNEPIQQPTRDSGRALSHVCRRLVDLTWYLLECSNSYVLLGWFTTDPREKAFWKLLQGSSGSYFITQQSVMEKVRTVHAKFALKKNLDIDEKDGLFCQHCNRELKEYECEIVDNLKKP